MDKKCIIVTGGAQGIGLGITKMLLSSGYHVAIFDIDLEALDAAIASMPSDAHLPVSCDVSDEASVKAAIAETHSRWGEINGLVNNAGIADPHNGPIEDLLLADWQKWLNTNLTAAFLTTKHSLPHLKRTRGSIVNIASTRAFQSEPNTEASAASKGGLVSLTHALAISLSGQVRVNAISPGWVAVDAHQKPSIRKEPQLRTVDHAQHPAGRVGTPDDIASLTQYLLSEKAAFITGQNFVEDGGMTKKMIYEK